MLISFGFWGSYLGMHSFPLKNLFRGHLHLLNIILPPMHGLHSYPIKASLFGHLQIPFIILPPMQDFLFIKSFGITSDDTNAKNSKMIKLFILKYNKIIYKIFII